MFKSVFFVNRKVAALALMCLALGACSSNDSAGPTREALLGQLSQEVLAPSVAALGQEVGVMHGRVSALCASGGASTQALEDARASWRAALVALAGARTYNLGPTRDRRLALNVAFWPLDEATLTAALTPGEGAPTLDATWLNAQGADAAGMYAAELLLFDPQLDADPGAAFDTQGRRCALLKVIVEDVRQRVDHVAGEWAGDAGFARELATAGAGSATYDSTKMALDAVINAWIGQLEMVINADLGEPLGQRAGGEPQPDEVRGHRGRAGQAAMLAQARAMQALYTHGGDASLRAFLASRSPELAARMGGLIDALVATIEGWPQPMSAQLTADTASVEAAQEQARALLRTLKAEVASVLGVTIAFTDNDGD